MVDRLRIVVERATTWAFASALDWPGWCRRGKGEEAAVQALLDYADRYARVAGDGFAPGRPTVVATGPGTGVTDFGALESPGPWDDEPLDATELVRQLHLLDACWSAFDAAADASAAELRKGPRGGGRDRDAIVEHVREAERSYARRIGVRVPPGTPWPEQRTAILDGLRGGVTTSGTTTWPPRYLVRRAAWHVLDHAWEIEDKQP